MKHDLQALKQRLTIPEVWRRLALPGEPRTTCRSPFRKDRNPSFSLFEEGRCWKDFGTGEGGDVIAFIARACSVDMEEATRRFLAMAGVAPSPLPGRSKPSKAVGVQASSASGGGTPVLPDRLKAIHQPSLALPSLHPGTVEEIAAVARSRLLSPAAVAVAQGLGTLSFGQVCGLPCWLLSDPSRRVAEARRVDRQPFPAAGVLRERKAHTVRGSSKSWPAGVAVLEQKPFLRAIMLVEGGPDYLAALHFCLAREVYDVLPVAMLGRGTGSKIDPEALALLMGRRVRLYPHNDADGGGLASAMAWGDQLCGAGCEIDYYSFTGLLQANGSPVRDLNDCSSISAADESQLDTLLP